VPRSLVGDVNGPVEPLRWQVPALGEADCNSQGNRLNNPRLSSRWSFDERQALLGNSPVGIHNSAGFPFLPVRNENGETSKPLNDISN
jgi:hypothetical protein